MLMKEIFLLLYNKLVFCEEKTKYIVRMEYIKYAIIEIWIDIAFPMLMINRFTKNLGPDHFSGIDPIFRYSSENSEKILHQKKNPNSNYYELGFWPDKRLFQ